MSNSGNTGGKVDCEFSLPNFVKVDPFSQDGADAVSALVGSLATFKDRLEYIVARLGPASGVSKVFTRTAFYAAGRLLGCSGARARRITQMVVRRGSVAAYLDWLGGPHPLTPLAVGPIDTNLVGFVYVAHISTDPNIIKIGFSTDVGRRLRDLKHETGCEHVLDYALVGTMVDEAVLHFGNANKRIAREWFFADKPALETIPPFLPIGQAVMAQALLNERRAS